MSAHLQKRSNTFHAAAEVSKGSKLTVARALQCKKLPPQTPLHLCCSTDGVLWVQPEMSRNVQKYSKEVYLRASEAQQCRVHSTVVLPLFTTGDRGTSLGIIEVVQTRQDMSFADIVTHLAKALEVTPPLVLHAWKLFIC